MNYVTKDMINCGGSCAKCLTSARPHGPYAYRVTGTRTRSSDNRKWKYLGKSPDEDGGAMNVEDFSEEGEVAGADGVAHLAATDGMSEADWRGEMRSVLLGRNKARKNSFLDFFSTLIIDTELSLRRRGEGRANRPAIHFLGEVCLTLAAERAEEVIADGRAKNINKLDFSDESRIADEAVAEYEAQRRDIVAMKTRSDEQYKRYTDALRDAGDDDLPQRVLDEKARLKGISRRIKREVDERSAGKSDAERERISVEVKASYEDERERHKQEVSRLRSEIDTILAPLHEQERQEQNQPA